MLDKHRFYPPSLPASHAPSLLPSLLLITASLKLPKGALPVCLFFSEVLIALLQFGVGRTLIHTPVHTRVTPIPGPEDTPAPGIDGSPAHTFPG